MKLKKLYNFFLNPNIKVLYYVRLSLWLYEREWRIIPKLIRNHILYKYGIHIGLGAKLGDNLQFPHPQGIIIGEGVIVGEGCTIYHQVTLGKKSGNLDSKSDYPKIGDNVTIFAGAKIIGNVEIGNNSIIAANSVVLKDVDANSVYGGIPAKKLK